MSFIDDFSPSYVGNNVIKLSLSLKTLSPAANKLVVIEVDYSGADAYGGIVLPLQLVVQAPTVAGFYRKIFSGNQPTELFYFPISGGKHLATLSELGHNQVFGALPFDVSGDQLVIPAIGRG